MAVGHRQRIREKIAECGLRALHDHEILEYVLYPFIPRKDVSQLARQLLNDFGSLYGVMLASPRELATYKDMTDNAAQYIAMMLEIYSRAMSQHIATKTELVNPFVCAMYVNSILSLTEHEKVVLVATDKKGRIVRTRVIDGKVDSAEFSVTDVAEFALSSKARGIVVGHNHPHSTELPSKDDLVANVKISECLKGIAVDYIDHVIIAGENYFSFKQNNIPLSQDAQDKVNRLVDYDYRRARLCMTDLIEGYDYTEDQP